MCSEMIVGTLYHELMIYFCCRFLKRMFDLSVEVQKKDKLAISLVACLFDCHCWIETTNITALLL